MIFFLFDMDQIIIEKEIILKLKKKGFIVGMISENKYVEYFDYIFCNNGLRFYKYGKLEKSTKMHEFYGEEYFQNILNMILLILCNTNLPYKRGHYQDFFLRVYPMGKNANMEINGDQYQEIIQELKKELKRYQLNFYDISNIGFSWFTIPSTFQ